MMTSWRIVKKNRLDVALMGLGSKKAGGRWNSPGVCAVYTSSTIALAMLELLVNISSELTPYDYIVLDLLFDESLIEIPGDIPHNWKNNPHTPETRQFGDQWIRERRTAVLRVPSAIVPQEYNYLINPEHPDFVKIKKGTVQDIDLDPRLIPSTRTR